MPACSGTFAQTFCAIDPPKNKVGYWPNLIPSYHITGDDQAHLVSRFLNNSSRWWFYLHFIICNLLNFFCGRNNNMSLKKILSLSSPHIKGWFSLLTFQTWENFGFGQTNFSLLGILIASKFWWRSIKMTLKVDITFF